MRAKWLSPHARACPDKPPSPVSAASFSGEFELRFDDKAQAPDTADEEEKITVAASPSPWRPVEAEAITRSPPAAKGKVVTGLASVL
uniref:Uncharacterized protein n=1 Tax=Arundo donax TaxID=35708 RepID=A0A0A9BK43_ARUDO